MVAEAFDPSTWKAEIGKSHVRLRLARATQKPYVKSQSQQSSNSKIPHSLLLEEQ